MSVLIKWNGYWTGGGGGGELHLDVPTFVQRQTQAKIKQLVKSVLKISINAEECARQIIEECEEQMEIEKEEFRKIVKRKDKGWKSESTTKTRTLKKYKLFIELVKPYEAKDV